MAGEPRLLRSGGGDRHVGRSGPRKAWSRATASPPTRSWSSRRASTTSAGRPRRRRTAGDDRRRARPLRRRRLRAQGRRRPARGRSRACAPTGVDVELDLVTRDDARAGSRGVASTTGSAPNSPELDRAVPPGRRLLPADAGRLPADGACPRRGPSGCRSCRTDVGAIREIVRPNETGLLVPCRDAAALAGALATARCEPPLRRQLGDGARASRAHDVRRGDERPTARRTCSSTSPGADVR